MEKAVLNLLVTDLETLDRLAGIEDLAGVLERVGGVLVIPESVRSARLDPGLRLPSDRLASEVDPGRVMILVGEGAALGFGGCLRIELDQLLDGAGFLAGARDGFERYGQTFETLASEYLSDGPQ